MQSLAEVSLKVTYRPGKQAVVPDALSRVEPDALSRVETDALSRVVGDNCSEDRSDVGQLTTLVVEPNFLENLSRAQFDANDA